MIEETTNKILIVDDEPNNLTCLRRLLKEYYTILIATSAASALATFDNSPDIDLLLLDIMMPEMDGYELLTLLKERPDTRHIPVIFLTALNDDLDEEKGLALGAVDFINKPFHPSTLLARVNTHIELKKARDILLDQNSFLEREVERRQLENQQIQLQLLQSDKMAAIGQLAAGITHEINNPVGFVNANLKVLEKDLNNVFELLTRYENLIELNTDATVLDEMRELRKKFEIDYLSNDLPNLIAESLEGLGGVRRIVQDLKSFSHTDEHNHWELTDVHRCLDSTLNIIWNELKYHCQIIKQYGAIPTIRANPAQLNQVFMNLLINAAQAIVGHGEIIIHTWQQNQEICIEIKDSGRGIEPDNLRHLFEPFFTTKPVGKGTGLGLSISHNLIKKHGGRIEVESALGEGAVFRVYLPLYNTQVNADLNVTPEDSVSIP